MRILFIGDLYGTAGISYLLENIEYLKQTYQPDCMIANAENAANGRGLTQAIYQSLIDAGITLLTMGNHTWKNKELKTFIDQAEIIRPMNDGSEQGIGFKMIEVKGQKLLVMNALGVAFMNEQYEPPYLMIKSILASLKYDYSLLDFHAEATSEKVAVAHFLDGTLDMMVGTHTHIQTNDERVMPKGMLYITDVGMTGPKDGVIGVEKDIIIDRFIFRKYRPNQVALGPRQLNAVLFTLDDSKSIQKIHLEEPTE